jgi:hypothetical protein
MSTKTAKKQIIAVANFICPQFDLDQCNVLTKTSSYSNRARIEDPAMVATSTAGPDRSVGIFWSAKKINTTEIFLLAKAAEWLRADGDLAGAEKLIGLIYELADELYQTDRSARAPAVC